MSLPHTHLRTSWLDEFVQLFESRSNWFRRKMRNLSEQDQQTVFAELQSRGHKIDSLDFEWDPIPSENGTGASKIIWTDEEWDKLTDIVWGLRKNAPEDSIPDLCKRAMPQFPENRRRNIAAVKAVQPLIERLKAKDNNLLTIKQELDNTRELLKTKSTPAMTREELLKTITDDDILTHFKQRILQLVTPDETLSLFPTETILANIPLPLILSHLIVTGADVFSQTQRGLTETVLELAEVVRQQGALQQQIRSQLSIPSATAPKPTAVKITVVGLLSIQQQELSRAFNGKVAFRFVDKNRKPEPSAIPDGQDVIILAANFISHAMQDAAKIKASGTKTRIVVVHGAVSAIRAKVQEIVDSSQ
jgi:hypothetical protein